MECRDCGNEIDVKDLNLEDNEGDVEVGFTCVKCKGEFFCILTGRTFLPVD